MAAHVIFMTYDHETPCELVLEVREGHFIHCTIVFQPWSWDPT